MKFRIVTALCVLLPFFTARTVAGLQTPLLLTFLAAFAAFGLGRVVERCMNGPRPRVGIGWLVFAGSLLGSLVYALTVVRAAGGELP